jgi:small conductance mechanosensitive channel
MDTTQTLEQYSAVTAELIDLGVRYGLSFLSAIAVLIIGSLMAKWLSRALRRRLEGVDKFDQTLTPILAQIVRYAVLVFTLILVLAEFGIQTTSIIAVLGAAGLAIGLALQGTLQNVSAGMMLLLLRPFHVGDYVDTGGGSGTVDEIGLFMTRMSTTQGLFVAVPNSQIWSSPITNYSKHPRRRLDLLIGISYDDDIDRAVTVFIELAKSDSRVLNEPAPVVVVKNLGESSVDLELRAWTARTDYWSVRFEMTRAVKIACDQAGISIPYPHRQLVFTQLPK